MASAGIPSASFGSNVTVPSSGSSNTMTMEPSGWKVMSDVPPRSADWVSEKRAAIICA